MMYGNKDYRKEFEFSEKSKNHYVVRFSRVEKMTSGHIVEDPGTVRYDYFTPTYWEQLVLSQEAMGRPDLLTRVTGETKMVLHDPTVIEEKKSPGRPKKEDSKEETKEETV